MMMQQRPTHGTRRTIGLLAVIAMSCIAASALPSTAAAAYPGDNGKIVFAGAPVGTPLLQGTPTVLLITRGGAYGPGTPREGWDHHIGYAQRILTDVWGADLTVVEREFTLAGVNPALDEFLDLAATLKGAAEDAAIVAGKSVVADRS